MALGFVARAMKMGLTKNGEPSFLRGEPCGKAAVHRHVETAPGIPSMGEDNYVARYDVASIDADYNPRVHDTFDHPDGTYKLDRLLSDNGYVRQFVIVKR